ncbi:MAG: radical SAM family heme chaperone HemW [Planctomycetota bacterium]
MPESQTTNRANSAYIHVPFCRHRCAYCNFTVVAGRPDLEVAYLDAIESELRGLGEPQPVQTVFVGGGTPTELTPDGLLRLCQMINEWFPRDLVDHETSFEANPDGMDEQRVSILTEHQVTRLSLGVQSFSADKLLWLDRQHTIDDTHKALELAESRFASLSIDLIFAAPGESLELWERDLLAAIATDANHVSTYGLTVEHGTLFWNRREKGQLTEVKDDLQGTMYELAIDRLTNAGFEHYEVSNFAKPNYRCRHNETYWKGEEYFAVGPGASRFIDGRRETNHRSTTTYIQRMLNGQSPVAESEEITDEERARERLVFGMRRLEGIHVESFDQANRLSVREIGGESLDQFVAEGLLEEVDGYLRLTRQGLLVSDSIWPYFL